MQDNQDVTVLPNHLFCHALQLEDLEQQVWQAQKQHPFQLEEWKDKYEINMSNGMWVQNGRGVVPEDLELRREIVRASHDHATAGHPEIKGTLQLTARNYWWPRMGDFILSYMKGCAQCQATKPSTNKLKVPLFPIIAEKSSQPFSTIALDLIIDLPPSKGYDSILTITDHNVSKAALFFPCMQKIGAAGVAELFATQVFPHFGVPTKVISNRDTCFTSHFTRELCRLLGIAQNISTAYHPQTDGQSERTNQWLKQYLRIYCNFQQDNWASLLPMAQYVHNSWTSHTTGFTPFELLLGFTPQIRPLDATSSTLPNLEEKGRFLKQLRERARQVIINAQQMVLQQRNRVTGQRMFQGFNVGDKVWLDGTNLRLSHPSKKLAAKQYGPFTVTRVISPVVYCLALPLSWKIFDTFHASLLSPYKETPEHGTNFTEPPPDLVDGAKEYEVEAVLGQQTYGRGKKKQYLIKWKGYSDAHNSWEAATDVNAPELVKEYLTTQPTQIRIIQDKRLGEVDTQGMPPSIPHRLSSSEYFYGYYPLDAIEATTQ